MKVVYEDDDDDDDGHLLEDYSNIKPIKNDNSMIINLKLLNVDTKS